MVLPVVFLTLGGGIIACINYFKIIAIEAVEKFWPVTLICIGILQSFNSRYKDLTSSILLIFGGVILLLFKLNLLTQIFLLNFWPDSLKQIIGKLFNEILINIF
jgi:hypothetical protein